MTEVTEFEREHRKRVRETKQPAKDGLREIAARKHGTETLIIRYDGSGDDGGITEFEWLDVEGKLIDAPEIFPPVDAALTAVETYVCYIADFNDEGSHGELVYTASTDKVTHRHYWYETVSKPERARSF